MPYLPLKTDGPCRHPNNDTPTVLLVLLLLSLLSCADKPTEPELTEEDVARIVAEELVLTDYLNMRQLILNSSKTYN